ncbi:MAG TPA: hypothetical protein DHV62_08180 [Elusimicrobia bacterium]|jgi:hypothetical protein|nr:hypothetical protein [Elusimicrobiota bacterium]
MNEKRKIHIKVDSKQFESYISKIEKSLRTGMATEQTHRPALKTLIESLQTGLEAINEPKRVACGAPDFILTISSRTIGYIEAKDVVEDLDKIEKSEQMERYLGSLPNLILTDYLEFKWYTDGKIRATGRLGKTDTSGKIKTDLNGLKIVQQLLSDFLIRRVPSVGTAKELAIRMARLGQMIRDLIIKAFETEPEKGTLHSQFQAFKDTLIPDLTPEKFADMYAQTIAYGLFAARTMTTSGKNFTRKDAVYLIPKTNPFLRNLFNEIAGANLDDRIAWLVDDLAQLLADANMTEILKDFGIRTKREDPVVHFYETFFTQYDKETRKMRGEYYTPEPVVSYIVRSVGWLLRKNFNCAQGFADSKILTLDPAVGTGTFLYSVIKLIYESLKDQIGTWNDYVEKYLLPRIFGFELMLAPYAICHLKLELLLKELGYQFKTDQRLGVYLTTVTEKR